MPKLNRLLRDLQVSPPLVGRTTVSTSMSGGATERRDIKDLLK